MTRKTIVVQIPCYNEAPTLPTVLASLPRRLPGGARVLTLVVDDGSTDGTGEAARAAGADVLRLTRNSGKGSAIRAGLAQILASDATHVVFMDADGQHDPDDLPRLMDAARRGEDFVIGSRMAEPDKIPAYRYRTNEIGSMVLTRMTGLEIEDGQSGYRVIAVRVLRGLDLSAKGYMIENEILLKAAPRLTRVASVPVRAVYGGPSHYRPFRDTWVISWGSVYYKVFECD